MDATDPKVGLEIDVAELPQHAQTDLGCTAWRMMEQDRVNGFADLTEDHNPIHVDPVFAEKTPFGGTIAHGYFTLAMVAPLLEELLSVQGASMSINYGLDKLRFPGPLPVGSRYRAKARLGDVDEIPGGFQLHVDVAIEVEDAPKPALAAECLFRHYA